MISRKTTAYISLLLAAAILPVVLWLLLPVGTPRSKMRDYHSVRQFDPTREGGHLLPNLDLLVQGEVRGHPVRFVTNAKGFRNRREFPHDVPDGTFRILFMGDSFVDGMRTDQEETIGFLLQRQLNERIGRHDSGRCEVLISGHNNCANAWYYYQEHGNRYGPQLVILGVTLGNDLTWHNYKGGMLPVRDERGATTLAYDGNPEQVAIHLDDLFLPGDAFAELNAPVRFARKIQHAVRRRLAERTTRFADAVPPRMAPVAGSPGHVNAAGYYISLGLFYQPLLPEIERMFVDFEEAIAGIHARTAQDGAELLVVLFPVRIQVSGKSWELLQHTYALDGRRFDLGYQNRRLKTFFDANGIATLDLLPAMKRVTEEEQASLYRRRGDMHFNEHGQRVAAEVICERAFAMIDSAGLLP